MSRLPPTVDSACGVVMGLRGVHQPVTSPNDAAAATAKPSPIRQSPTVRLRAPHAPRGPAQSAPDQTLAAAPPRAVVLQPPAGDVVVHGSSQQLVSIQSVPGEVAAIRVSGVDLLRHRVAAVVLRFQQEVCETPW